MDKSNEPPHTGAHYLTNIVTSSQKLTLESLHTLRITEQIEVEEELASIITTTLREDRYKH